MLEVDDCASRKLKSILYPPVNTLVAKRETRMNEPQCSDKKTALKEVECNTYATMISPLLQKQGIVLNMVESP